MRRRRGAGIGAAVLTVVVGLAAAGCDGSSSSTAGGCRADHARDCVDVDLSRQDLRRWHLRGADLRGANLSRSDLRGVDLQSARLDRANLARADLRGADLRDAGFASAALEEADLRGALLDRARFSAARLMTADLRGARFGTSFFTDADLTGARLSAVGAIGVGACDTTMPNGVVTSCATPLAGAAPATGSPATGSPRLAVDLTRLAIRLVQRDRLNPPIASRVYAYTGIALAETVRPNSLALRGLPAVPAAAGPVDAEVVAASGAPIVPHGLTMVASTRAAYAALRDEALARLSRRPPAAEFARSVGYGRGVAARILQWAGTDGFTTTRDRPYTAPTGPGRWVPTPTTFQSAQEPYWGTLRPYALSDLDRCSANPPPAYSTEPDSSYMRQARAVYETSRRLTDAQRAAARFWADDRGRTGTPAGHWVATTNVAVAHRHLDLGHAAMLHGVVGVAAGDAFIQAWNTKFRYNEIRPVTTIRAVIDPRWTPYLNTPPFPDWISGHATVSGAEAAVLTAIAGSFPYRDLGFSTGSDVRASFSIRPRTFASFVAAAGEAAKSREYAGIHYPASDAEGLRVGACIGQVALAARR